MPRSIWNGTVTFGLIAVPIKVNSATEDKSVHFHQVHAKDGARIKQKRICSKEGKEVPYKEVAKGYETSSGKYVLLSPEEIAAAAGESSHRIALEEFVSADDIDPVFYDRTYFLAAGDDGADAYRLLHDALAKSGRVGLGRWVFHNREYLAAIRPLDRVMALHTMRFSDELVQAKDLELPKPSRVPTKREIDMAQALVDSLHGAFSPTKYKDTYREHLLGLIARKAKGEEIEHEPAPEPEETADLMAALEASLSGGKQSKRGQRRSGSSARSRRTSGSRRKSSKSRS
jgi:DNA end-binding protein Ku